VKSVDLAVPAIVVAVLAAAASVDHYFRDEFYYLACSRRLAWGYVDQPPLSIAVLWIVRHAAGESLIVLRLAAALTLGASVWLTGSLARRLGASGFGAVVAMVTVAIAPQFLGIASFYSMNVFDVLLWTAALRVFVDAAESGATTSWLCLGVLLGLGLLNKVSVLWLGAGLGAALLLTPSRRALLTRGPSVAAGVAAVFFVPHILWQIAHGWPTLEFIRNASSEKMLSKAPWAFMAEQVMNLHPVTLPIWGGGLVALLTHPQLRRSRALAIVYMTVAAILMVNATSRSGYLLPAYPALIAAGGVLWERLLVRPVVRATAIVVLAASGAATLPLAVPILPVDTYVRYSRALGVAPSTEEKKDLGRLPQFFADRQGWDAFVDQVAAVWSQLPPAERSAAAVLTGNYGEAGAVEQLARARGLVAISGHNNYWFWGPAGRTGDVLIVLSTRPDRLQQRFDDVQLAGRTDCGDCMPYENGVGIYICRHLKRPMADVWPMLKHFE